jgi:hypothetical protein
VEACRVSRYALPQLATPAQLTPPERPRPALPDRLLAAVRTHCADGAVLACPSFVAGGKLHGVGIPSELYCQVCGHASLWHDVVQAAAIVAAASQEVV